jgi:hypothetical protein
MTALSFWPIKRKEVTVSDCLVTVFTMYCHLDKPLWHKALRDFKTFTLLSPDYHVLSPKSLKGGVICRNFKQFDAPGGGKISQAAFATFGRLPPRRKTLIQTGI